MPSTTASREILAGFRSLVASCLLAGLASPALALTYYVSEAGDDGADGTSSATAWATLQHAADSVAPGDTVIALPGRYAGFNLFSGGTPGARIIFTANPGVPAPNPAVIIDRPNAYTGRDAINLEGASHVTIQGFTLEGNGNPATSRAGIRSVGFDDDLARENHFRHNRADRHGRWGIFTGFVDDLLIEGNITSRSVDEHGIYVSNSGDRPVIRANVIWGNRANGVHMNGDASLGNDGVISAALVEGNVIFDNGTGGGSGINADGVQDSLFRNNLLFDNHASGISLYRIDGGAPSIGNRVINNTVVNASDGRWAMNIQDASAGNTLYNNIFLNLHPSRGSIDLCGACLTGFESDHNIVKDRMSFDDVWIDLAEWRASTGQDAGTRIASAAELFVNAPGSDYRLLASAPAVDAGTALEAPARDVIGSPRPLGAGVDIGAFEHVVELALSGGTPGIAGRLNTFEARGASPGTPVALLVGRFPGALPLPACPGLSLGVTPPTLVSAALADAGGTARFAVQVPASAAGLELRFQAFAPLDCEISGRLDRTFTGAP